MITAVPHKNSSSDGHEYHNIFNRLQTFVDSLDKKLMNKIQSIQHNFADQYKQAVRMMNEQLQEIRNRLDAAALKQKANQKIKLLEQQRNLFREMSRDLDIKLKEQVKTTKQLRNQIKDLENQLQNYKKVCFKLQMQMTKSRKQMVEIYKSKSSLTDKRANTHREIVLEKINQNSLNSDQEYKKSARKSYRHAVSHTTLPMKRNFSSTIYKSQKQRIIAPAATTAPTFQFEQIFTNCINSIKKQLLYRTATTLTNNYQSFIEQGSQIPFQKFTLTDKKQLVKSFIENPKILDKLYEFVFNKEGDKNEEKLRSTTVRLFDNKYNEKSLLLMKRKFEQRVATTRLGNIKDK